MAPQNCMFALCLLSGATASADKLDRLFMHGGHTDHLAEFSWNLNDPWLVASAAEDNVVQIWKVADAIVGRDDQDIPIDELDH